MPDSTDIKPLVEAIRNLLDERARLEPEVHAEHHAFVKALMERERRKTELWEKVKTQVLGWGLIAAVGTLGTIIFEWLQHMRGQP